MANPPPPYDDVTGISRAVMKDNAQVTLAEYNGNARPGELVVNLETNPPALYVGNNIGQLTAIAGGGASLPLANGTSNFNIPVASGNVEIEINETFWTFDTTGNLNIPNNIVGGSTIRIENTATGGSADIQLLPADDILLQGRNRDVTSTTYEGGDINIYGGDGRPGSDGDDSGSGGDIQIYAGGGGPAGDFDAGGGGGIIYIEAGFGGLASAVDTRNAGSGGSLNLSAGGAGGADGNSSLGAQGGSVIINAGQSTGNGLTGGGVVINTGNGGPNSSSGPVQINIPSSDAGPGGTWGFDYTGTFTVPAAIQLAVYADTTARDAAIPSPAPGMMIYVTGTGMQVYGATQWNTVAGTGT